MSDDQDTEDKNPIQEQYDERHSGAHTENNLGGGDKGSKDKTVDLDKAEDGAVKSDKETKEKEENSGLYGADTGPRKGTLWSSADRFRGFSRTKKRVISGGVMMGIAGVLSVILMSAVTPALELFHIKEVLTQRIGDVQSLVVKTRSGKIYSRAFFFDEDGFDGYKSRGSIFSIYDNYKTTNLLDDIRAVDPSFNIEYNQRSGRVKSISWTENGIVQTVDSSEEFASLWKKRGGLTGGGITTGLRTAYPEKGLIWRARQAKKFYARAGLSYTLSNVLENTKLAQMVDDLAEKLGRTFSPGEVVVAKFRQAVFGDIFKNYSPGGIRVDNGALDEEADAETRASSDESQNISDDLADESDGLVEKVKNDPNFRPKDPPSASRRGFLGSILTGNADEIAAKMIKASSRAAVVGNIVDTSEKLCRVKYLLDIIEIGARTTRLDQLGEYFTNFASPADAGKAGDLSSDSTAGMISRVHAVDENGDGFYSGGGYAWLSGREGIVNPDNIDKFSAGGGSVETLSFANEFINNSGGGIISKSCSVATNPVFQVLAGLGEAIVTYGPCVTGLGCAWTASKLAVGASVAAAKEGAFAVAMAIIRPIAVRLTAGVVVDYLEVGPEMSDALVSGAGSWFGRRSSFSGMRPLSSRLFAQLESDVQEERQHYYAQKSFYDKYLNPGDTESLMFASIINMPRSFNSFLASTRNLINNVNPINLVASVYGNSASGTALAINNASSQCADPTLASLDIATDPFCNPIYGEDLDALDTIDPLDNINWMIDHDYIEADLSASGEVIAKGEYKDYVDQCFLSITPIRDAQNSEHPECFSNGASNKFLRFRAFRLDRDISQGIADNINKDFDY